jgi:hypothetical protein
VAIAATLCSAALLTINVVEIGKRSKIGVAPRSPRESTAPISYPVPNRPPEVGATISTTDCGRSMSIKRSLRSNSLRIVATQSLQGRVDWEKKSGPSSGFERARPRSLSRPQPIRLGLTEPTSYGYSQPLGGSQLRFLVIVAVRSQHPITQQTVHLLFHP